MSTTTTNPLPSFADAITAAETTESNYANGLTQLGNDQNVATAAHAKADAADQVVTGDQKNVATLASADVQALETLGQVIAARITALTPPPPPPPGGTTSGS